LTRQTAARRLLVAQPDWASCCGRLPRTRRCQF